MSNTVGVDYKALLAKDDFFYDSCYDSPIHDKTTFDGEKIFKVAHETLVNSWQPTDYELILHRKGICEYCCTWVRALHPPKEIITQLGATRFGVTIGFCLPCINELVQKRKLERLNIKIPFESSDDIHEVGVTVNRLQDLMLRETPLNDSLNETEQVLSQTHKGLIKQILDDCSPWIDQINKEKEKPLLCKQCVKISISDPKNSKYVDRINQDRKTQNIAGMCLGCGLGMLLDSGCSIATCPSCLSQTKTCLVCMDGATGLSHDLKICSQKMQEILQHPNTASPLPDLQKCNCH